MKETPVYKWPVLTGDDPKTDWAPYWNKALTAIENTVSTITSTPIVYGAANVNRMDPIPNAKTNPTFTVIGRTDGVAIGTDSVTLQRAGVWQVTMNLRCAAPNTDNYMVLWGLGISGVWGYHSPQVKATSYMLDASTTRAFGANTIIKPEISSPTGTGTIEQGTFTVMRLGD